MGKDSMILRDLLASCMTTGATSINTTLTATDCMRAVIDDTGTDPALRISIGSGGSGSVTFPGDVNVTGNLYVTGNTYETDQYVTDELIIGNKSTLGSWRFIQNNGDLLVQKLTDVTGQTWTVKGTFLGS